MRRLLRRFWSWTGIPERRVKKVGGWEVQPAKTLWDWMQLVLVPAILIGVTLVWSATQTGSANKREDRLSQDALLLSYFTEMSGLTIDKKLLSSKEGDPIRTVARTATLTVLHRLNGDRKEEVVHSLLEAGLVRSDLPIVQLHDADLRGANFNGADLRNTDLHVVRLEGAHLEGALLSSVSLLGAHLEGAHLGHADASQATIEGAYLARADLNRAVLTGADLNHADLTGADLNHADLTAANLTGADLTGANLTGADLTGANLTGAKGLPKRSK